MECFLTFLSVVDSTRFSLEVLSQELHWTVQADSVPVCGWSLGPCICNDVSQERNQKLKSRAAQLEKQIKVLIDDSVALLKARMSELGINASSPGDLLAKAKEIVLRHKELQAKASRLQAQVRPSCCPMIR
jgi:hypothetical protein